MPGNLREGADALGVSRWRTVLTVILPSALGGILTATVLAVARAAGETAPLILVSSVFDGKEVLFDMSHAIPNVPVRIFTLSEEGEPRRHRPGLGNVAGVDRPHPPRKPRSAGRCTPAASER